MLRLKVGMSNNDPKIIAWYYLHPFHWQICLEELVNLLQKLILNQRHFKLHGNHNFSESIQVGQQYGGNAVTIATAKQQRWREKEKTSTEAV